MVYQVKLPVFEGPLDLLLHLIRVNQIDIYDIPIARITDEYFRYLTLLPELDLEVAGEFLVMAATLVYIKSRMLLPAEPAAEGEIFEEDPRSPLVDMLLEYQRFKTASEEFAEREERQRHFFFRSTSLDLPASGETLEISILDLLGAFQEVLTRIKDRPLLELAPRSVTVAERMVAILDRVTGEEPVTFQALFPPDAGRSFVIVTFLALLELLRQGAVRVRQLLPFGDIMIERAVA
ncbi:MAG: segregation and condensation protein A [Candidatus Methylomirabilales bacterium]